MSNRGARLVMLTALWLFCTVSGFAQAQQNPQTQNPVPKPVTRVIHLKYVSPGSVASALSPFTKYELATVVANNTLRTVTLSGSAETVSAMELAIRDLDVAPKPLHNIAVTADLILASDEKQPEPPIPARLEPALKQLRVNFSYKSYQLLDSVVLRNLEGNVASMSGSAAFPGTDKPVQYKLSYLNTIRGDQQSKSVYLDQLRIGLEVPAVAVREEAGYKTSQSAYRLVALNTNLEIREGQQAVIGKAGLGDGSAVIAVISVKIE